MWISTPRFIRQIELYNNGKQCRQPTPPLDSPKWDPFYGGSTSKWFSSALPGPILVSRFNLKSFESRKMNFVNIYFQNWIKRCWCWKFNKNDFNWVFNNIFPSRRVGLCFNDPWWSQITLLASSSKIRSDNPHEFRSCLRRHSPSN